MVKEESIVLAQDGAFMRMEIGDSGYNNPGTALVHSCYFAKFAAAFFWISAHQRKSGVKRVLADYFPLRFHGLERCIRSDTGDRVSKWHSAKADRPRMSADRRR